MTREEAHKAVSFKLSPTWNSERNCFQVDKHRVHELIDKIYSSCKDTSKQQDPKGDATEEEW